jgi:glucose/arabinose dehydrogenase
MSALPLSTMVHAENPPRQPDRTAQMRLLTGALALLLLAGCGQSPVTSATPTLRAPTPAPAVTSAPAATGTATSAAATPVALNLPTTTPTVAPFAPLALELVADGLESPLFVTHAGDGSGRLFVVEKTGAIRILENGALHPAPFLDVSAKITLAGNEQGLLGLVFAPDFETSGHFYINYTSAQRDAPAGAIALGTTIVERYAISAADPNRADPDSAFEILRVAQPARNHNAGMLAFGPDGYLYVLLGDGGGSAIANGQDPNALLGKGLRLDVSDPAIPYQIPADNPFVTAGLNGVDVRDEIYFLGFRNPWRYSFDRVTGDLWIGDVGQNIYEEINVVTQGMPGGLNFGWAIMEATHCYGAETCDTSGLTLPVAEYAHGEDGCSVTGGYVYRGSAVPGWGGHYFFIDTALTVASFGEDEAGELYVVDYAGALYRMVAGE